MKREVYVRPTQLLFKQALYTFVVQELPQLPTKPRVGPQGRRDRVSSHATSREFSWDDESSLAFKAVLEVPPVRSIYSNLTSTESLILYDGDPAATDPRDARYRNLTFILTCNFEPFVRTSLHHHRLTYELKGKMGFTA